MSDRLTPIAKNLRKNLTEAEKMLWGRFRSNQLEGLKFRRQVPIGTFIADFVCHERKIVVEVDGGQHADDQEDLQRDAWFKGQGYRVLRFWNNDVLSNIDGVLEKIRGNC